MNIPVDAVVEVASHGSPALLNAVGRAFGLGLGEQEALARGQISRWVMLGLGLAVGLGAGAYAYRRWPNYIDKIIDG